MSGDREHRTAAEDASASPIHNVLEPIMVEVHPGTGVVDRHRDSLLVIPAIGQRQWPNVQRLLQICNRGADTSGRSLARAIAALLAVVEPDDVPGFALMIGTDTDVTVLAQGDVDVTGRGTAELSFTGAGSLTWVERRIAGPLAYLRVVASGTAEPEMTSPVRFHLEDGTVPGSGATLHRGAPVAPAEPEVHESTPPSDSRTTAHETVARPAYQFESVLLSDVSDYDAQDRVPLPFEDVEASDEPTPEQESPLLVEGVDCSAGHFNDPAAQHCATCGVALERESLDKVTRPRPALGVLVTDNGSVFSVIGDYVIGRAPDRDEAVLSGRAKPLVLRDVGQSVSRVHAHLTVSGWQVLVVDRGSSNGTFVSRSGQVGPWERLSEDTPTPLAPGARLRVGGRQLLFERYHEGTPPGTGR